MLVLSAMSYVIPFKQFSSDFTLSKFVFAILLGKLSHNALSTNILKLD